MALQLRTKLINEKKQHGLNASICFKIKDIEMSVGLNMATYLSDVEEVRKTV
jgi:hypothetical protein